MIRFTTLAALLVLSAVPALAADAVTCSTSDPSKFQPQQTLIDQLKTAGITVKQIKVEKGCYEVYGIDKAGKKVNTAYNAETLKQVANAEAGEN